MIQIFEGAPVRGVRAGHGSPAPSKAAGDSRRWPSTGGKVGFLSCLS
jgi:hypothetical protein